MENVTPGKVHLNRLPVCVPIIIAQGCKVYHEVSLSQVLVVLYFSCVLLVFVVHSVYLCVSLVMAVLGRSN